MAHSSASAIRWVIDFNEVRPHDALGGKTPAEVYRDSERRTVAPILPSYPPGSISRRVSRTGNISVNDDVVFVSTALSGCVVGLQQEDALRWRAHFFGVDLGSIEIIPSLGDLYASDRVSSFVASAVSTEQPSKRRTTSIPDTRREPRKNAVNT